MDNLLYIVGSDLEYNGNNYLSEFAKFETNKIYQYNYYKNLERFNNELRESGLKLPKFFYYPNITVESNENLGASIELPGAGSSDINEIYSEDWSDNIKIVIQTGGARKWDEQMVNHNRTQRFLYNKGVFKEASNLALKDSSNPDTLAKFLEF